MLKHHVARLFRWRFARYVLASASGTVVDLGSFLLLYAAGMIATVAAVIGYALGTLVHWLISSRVVFPDRLAEAGLKRGGQQILFVGSAILGMGLTALVVAWGEAAGFDPRLAKLAAMALSFLAVWLVRLTIVFRASHKSPEI